MNQRTPILKIIEKYWGFFGPPSFFLSVCQLLRSFLTLVASFLVPSPFTFFPSPFVTSSARRFSTFSSSHPRLRRPKGGEWECNGNEPTEGGEPWVKEEERLTGFLSSLSSSLPSLHISFHSPRVAGGLRPANGM